MRSDRSTVSSTLTDCLSQSREDRFRGSNSEFLTESSNLKGTGTSWSSCNSLRVDDWLLGSNVLFIILSFTSLVDRTTVYIFGRHPGLTESFQVVKSAGDVRSPPLREGGTQDLLSRSCLRRKVFWGHFERLWAGRARLLTMVFK